MKPERRRRIALTRPAHGEGRYVPPLSSAGEYGHVKIRVYPRAPGSGFAFESYVAGGAIPKEFISAVEQGLRAAASFGLAPGYPVEDVRVELYDGSYHDVDSSEAAFKMAANIAFQDAVQKAGPVGGMFDDDHVSPVMQPRHPAPAPRDSAIALPEPDDAVDDHSDSTC